MGFLDKAKDLISEHADKIDGGIEKAQDLIQSKTGDDMDKKVESAGNKLQDVVAKMDSTKDATNTATDTATDTATGATPRP